jgi:hypothetical protein
MSNYEHPTKKALFQLFLLGALFLHAGFTHAENPQALRDRQRSYQVDRQRCLAGDTGQNQASCLQEAGAVLQQPLSVQGPVSDAQLAANALQRCDALTGDEHQSCILRMQGSGSVEGSAASGAILRELIEPAR